LRVRKSGVSDMVSFLHNQQQEFPIQSVLGLHRMQLSRPSTGIRRRCGVSAIVAQSTDVFAYIYFRDI